MYSSVGRLASYSDVKIKTIYDIGTYRGKWSLFTKRYFPDADFFLFEANDDNIPYLDATGFRYFRSHLSSESGSREFFSNGSTGDSFYLENSDFYNKGMGKHVTTDTLDGLAQAHCLPPPDFLKLDVQGAELDILHGGRATLSNCAIVYMECPILSYNEKAPSIVEYIESMESFGFLPLDVGEIHICPARSALVQVDILFRRI
jgi:FkbM family methyltransferase